MRRREFMTGVAAAALLPALPVLGANSTTFTFSSEHLGEVRRADRFFVVATAGDGAAVRSVSVNSVGLQPTSEPGLFTS